MASTVNVNIGKEAPSSQALYRKRIVKIPFVQQVTMTPKTSMTSVVNGTRTLIIKAPMLRLGSIPQATNNTGYPRPATNIIINRAISINTQRPANVIQNRPPSIVIARPPTIEFNPAGNFVVRNAPAISTNVPAGINVRVGGAIPILNRMTTAPTISVSSGQRDVLQQKLKIQRGRNPTPSPSPPLHESKLTKGQRFRNPTPSPSPPRESNQSGSLLRKAFLRNPTPPPSPEGAQRMFRSNQYTVRRTNLHNKGALVIDEQLPVISSCDIESSGLNEMNSQDGSSSLTSSQCESDVIVTNGNFFDDLTSYENLFSECADLSSNNTRANGLKHAFSNEMLLEDLEKFALEFKRKRIKLGFTQCDVSVAIGKMYDLDYSQTTVSRFEALNLSFRNMCRLKPILERWLVDTEVAIKKGMFEDKLLQRPGMQAGNSGKRRKKRTNIEGAVKKFLESMYHKQSKPSLDLINELASSLNLSPETIRTWFCNRRQRDQRSRGPKSPQLFLKEDIEDIDDDHFSKQIQAYAFTGGNPGTVSSSSSTIASNHHHHHHHSNTNNHQLTSCEDGRFDKTPSPRRDDAMDDMTPLLSSTSRQHSTSKTAGKSLLVVRDMDELPEEEGTAGGEHRLHFDEDDDDQPLDFKEINSDEDDDDVSSSFLDDDGFS